MTVISKGLLFFVTIATTNCHYPIDLFLYLHPPFTLLKCVAYCNLLSRETVIRKCCPYKLEYVHFRKSFVESRDFFNICFLAEKRYRESYISGDVSWSDMDSSMTTTSFSEMSSNNVGVQRRSVVSNVSSLGMSANMSEHGRNENRQSYEGEGHLLEVE